ncbi:hypothetical protein C2E21_7559 [Chlorella sorokiniana]|uniref:Uncharacterized protein n=1 Tax=Chlorella sorokiniana TaxID=3076 RepID=A0A2P6TGX4_CHLSO|nr:hypothetical protein C2E21_7559 [Chlorella sorokiniana]|eukprot:PRW33516.1 hypothetical protein C2E21_7559 [Chlorella sorokiniana]
MNGSGLKRKEPEQAGTVLQQQTSQQHHAQQPPRPPAQQQQPLIQQQPAQALPLPQPLGLPPTQAVPWQQPPAVWPSAAAALGWPPQPPQQLWQQQHTQQQQQQTLPTWDPCMGPAWDPVLQQWTTAEPALQQHAQQHAQQPQHQQWPSRATAPPPSHPGLGWQSQAAALQQQLSAQQQGMLPPDQPQAAGQGQHATKLQRDVPPGGPAEALLRLAVRICCQRLGPGEHDGKQLGKVLEELDRNWRTSTCGGHSVTVLLKELDRRGLVVAREDTSGGKRICYFRNIAC